LAKVFENEVILKVLGCVGLGKKRIEVARYLLSIIWFQCVAKSIEG
jgi:hypothetical protein